MDGIIYSFPGQEAEHAAQANGTRCKPQSAYPLSMGGFVKRFLMHSSGVYFSQNRGAFMSYDSR
jgi:hypothetical protein